MHYRTLETSMDLSGCIILEKSLDIHPHSAIIGGMKEKKTKWFENYRKIRKPMPPPTKVIQPKNKKEKFDWRKESNETNKGEI